MTAKRVILHLGAPKTGTSSIQHACLLRREDLRRRGIIFPAPPFVPDDIRGRHSARAEDIANYGAIADFDESHISLFQPFQRRFHPSTVLPAPLANMRGWWEDQIAYFRQSDARTMIISCEILFFEINNYDMRSLMRLFRGLAVTVVFGLRHPTSMFEGLFATNVTGVQRDASRAQDMPVINGYLKYGFEDIAGTLIRRVGRGAVRPFYASTLWRSNRSVMGAFLDHCGIFTPLEQDFHSRPSLPPPAVMLLARLNSGRLNDADFNRVLAAIQAAPAFGMTDTKGSVFPRSVQIRLAKRYARDVVWAEKQFAMTPPPDANLATGKKIRRPSANDALAALSNLPLDNALQQRCKAALRTSHR